jgi:uncharacterized protein
MLRRGFLALPAAAYAASKDLYNRLLGAAAQVEVFDTHEHILPESERVRQPIDFFTLAGHYLMDDLTSAGLPAQDRTLLANPEGAEKDKWRVFSPYWRYARKTGYGEALQIAVREIYGIEEISAGSLGRINDAVRSRNKPGLYREVLKERARIRVAVNDEYWQNAPEPVDPEFFVLARKFDWFVSPITPAGLRRLEPSTDTSISNLAALKRAMEKHFEMSLKVGMVAVKSTLAYQREIYYAEFSAADASRDFEKLMRGEGVVEDPKQALQERPFRALADHMFHHLVQLADAHRVPMQIHTGMQAGNGNYIAHTRPSQLSNLFLRYPQVKFDVFHIGYPYQNEVAVLAKMFPNVYADYCWMHVLSPSATRAALNQMLDSVPANKIFGFGGDYRYPELSYAHLVIARRNIATVLANRVEDGAYTEEEAAETARWLLHDNPAGVFPGKRVGSANAASMCYPAESAAGT